MMALTTSFSVFSFIAVIVSLNFFCTSCDLGCILLISSFAKPCARVCDSRNLLAVFTATCASAAALSTAFVSPFFVFFSPPAAFPSVAAAFSSASAACPSASAAATASVSMASVPAASASAVASESSLSKASTSSASLATFSSADANFAVASSTTRFAESLCSTLPESFLNFPSSDCAVLSRVWYLINSEATSADMSLPLDSICRAVMNFLAAASAALAAFSASSDCCDAARISSADRDINFASSVKISAAWPTCFESSSALETSLSASFIVADFFLSALFFFNSVNRLPCASSSVWNSLSLAVASPLNFSVKRLASTSFVAMNILAMETAVFAVDTAASQPFTAESVSSNGRSSTPMRKGPSASAAFVTVSSTLFNLSAASCRTLSQTDFSVNSRCWLRS
mmetsp:Transcript_313/g.907  ORF Transcript_313/g.907 Transcript_313/m.907 type:complete len:401 (-) Transcript_313:398-1600(-)